jgi:hypothetical protein
MNPPHTPEETTAIQSDLAVEEPSAVDTSFNDGIGRRTRGTEPTGEAVETLRLCREISDAPTTETALVERARRLASFSHPSFAAIRRVERLHGGLGGLTVVSQAVPGLRLAEALRLANRKMVAPDLDAAMCLLKQVADALAALHQEGRELAHGALGPERVVVRPDGKAVLVEHVLGPALEHLQLGRTRLWTQFRVPVPAVAGVTRFDQATDILQLGVLALTLVLGRSLLREEFPLRLGDLLAEASNPDPVSGRRALSRAVRSWMVRTFQFEPRGSFRNGVEAAAALNAALSEEPRPRILLATVQQFLAAATPALGDAAPPATRVADEPKPEVLAPAATPLVTPRPPAPASEAAAAPLEPRVRSFDSSMTRRVVPRATRRHEPETVQVLADLPLLKPAVDPGSLSPGQEEPVLSLSAAPDRPTGPSEGEMLRAAATSAAAWLHRMLERRPLIDSGWLRQVGRVAAISAGLVALFGATYLGARGYFGLPVLGPRTGTLFVESFPMGAELMVDGLPGGRTPARLELNAGVHTLTLRTTKVKTVVPVTVVAGARTVEQVDLRPQRHSGRQASPSAPPARPPK